MPGFPVYHQLRELAQTHVHRVGDAIQPSHPLPSPSPLPSIFPSIRVFSSESALHIMWPKYWNFSFSISPFNEYSGLISFRIDWLDLLTDQRTLKSLLQYHSLKASILQRSATGPQQGVIFAHCLPTFENVWRDFWLWQLEGVGIGIRKVEARDAAKYLTMYRILSSTTRNYSPAWNVSHVEIL